ncbi:MAG: pimeloyl-ACP methyl ester esterase BioH [bacterium]
MHLHIESVGEGKNLVFLHGWGMHGGVWHHVLDQLKQHFRCHVVDLPGHGLSHKSLLPAQPAEVVKMIAEQINEPAIWMGWSLGGLVAMQAALMPSINVKQLVMVASSPVFIQQDDWPYGQRADVFKGFSHLLDESIEATIKRFIGLEVMGLSHAKEHLATMLAVLAERPQASSQSLKQGLAWLEQCNYTAQLDQIICPAVYISGRKDRIVESAALQAAAERTAYGQFYEFQRAAHAPFISHPQEFVELLLKEALNNA